MGDADDAWGSLLHEDLAPVDSVPPTPAPADGAISFADTWDDAVDDELSLPTVVSTDFNATDIGCTDTGPTAQAGPRRRGRPKGSTGSRLLRESVAAVAAAQEAAVPLQIQPVQRLHQFATAKRNEAALQKRDPPDFGPVHLLSPVQRTLASALKEQIGAGRQLPAGAADKDDVEALDFILNGAGLSCSASAFITQTSKITAQRKLVQSGAASVEGCGFLVAGMLTTSSTGPASSMMRPVMLVLKIRYDETPTRVRVATMGSGRDGLSPGQEHQKSYDKHIVVPKTCADGLALKRHLATMGVLEQTIPQAATHAKVLQTQAELIALYECQDKDASRKFICVQTPLLCSLQAMDRSTGENQRQAIWESVRSVPELSRLAADFDSKSACPQRTGTWRISGRSMACGSLDIWTSSPCRIFLATCVREPLV